MSDVTPYLTSPRKKFTQGEEMVYGSMWQISYKLNPRLNALKGTSLFASRACTQKWSTATTEIFFSYASLTY